MPPPTGNPGSAPVRGFRNSIFVGYSLGVQGSRLCRSENVADLDLKSDWIWAAGVKYKSPVGGAIFVN